MTLPETSTVDRDAELRDRVRELIATTFLLDATELSDTVSQETCARWTSLYHMMLLVSIEEQFGMNLSIDEMTTMTSMQKIVAVLRSHDAST